VARGTNWTPVVLLALVAAIGFGLLLAAKSGWFAWVLAARQWPPPTAAGAQRPAPPAAATAPLPSAAVAQEPNANPGP
jgi:hypothetical protein